MRALVIDDSRAIRLILGQILKALKFERVIVKCGVWEHDQAAFL